ncbi:MAG: hypothetical protein U1E65_29560 [Myxococcota bacterium]
MEPNRPEDLVELAGQAARAGERTKAALILAEASARFAHAGRVPHAIAALRTAQRISGFEPIYTQRLALLYRSLADFERASEAFEEAARRADELGRAPLAQELFLQAQCAEPSRPGPWLWFAERARQGMDLELAARIIERGIAASRERGAPPSINLLFARLAQVRAELAAMPEAEIIADEDATVPIAWSDIQALLEAQAAPSIVLASAPLPPLSRAHL